MSLRFSAAILLVLCGVARGSDPVVSDRAPATGAKAVGRMRGPRLPDEAQSQKRVHATRWYALAKDALEHATVVESESNGQRSANATRIVTLRTAGGRLLRGVWKPVGGEHATIEAYPAGSGFEGTSPYPLKTLFRNEVRASMLAESLGLHFLVPPTVERTLEGERGSMQLFVEHADDATTRPAERPLDRPAAEKLRVFDYLIGNADRSAANLMTRTMEGRYVPVGIDHGLSFPVGTTLGLRERPMPAGLVAGHVGPLLAETRDFIGAIDSHAVARTLLVSGAVDRQVAHVLRRLEHLKRDPSFLEIARDGREGTDEMLKRVADAASSRSQELPADVTERINAIIAESHTR
ncbi:MAG: hypothetical protein ABI445_17315 [Polyangia bacterium]